MFIKQHSDPEQCCVCLDAMGMHSRMAWVCSHRVHLSCLEELFAATGEDTPCPLCRQPVRGWEPPAQWPFYQATT